MAKTKSDLINLTAERMMLPRIRSEMIVGRVFDSMAVALMRGEGIEVRGFGTFSLRTYGEYNGRNPRTGESVHVKAKRLPFFRVRAGATAARARRQRRRGHSPKYDRRIISGALACSPAGHAANRHMVRPREIDTLASMLLRGALLRRRYRK